MRKIAINLPYINTGKRYIMKVERSFYICDVQKLIDLKIVFVWQICSFQFKQRTEKVHNILFALITLCMISLDNIRLKIKSPFTCEMLKGLGALGVLSHYWLISASIIQTFGFSTKAYKFQGARLFSAANEYSMG